MSPTRERAHGDYRRYLRGPDEHNRPGKGCRCGKCRKAHGDRLRDYRAHKAREQWGTHLSRTVDAEPVRAHVQSLMATGVPWKTIARLAGVSDGCMGRLLYGAPPAPPTARMKRGNAEKILAVLGADALAQGGYVDAAGTARRVQALVAVGWTQSEIARRLGMNRNTMSNLMGCKRVPAARVRAVRALYEQLWNARPPEETAYQRRDVEAARRLARRNGWPPPGGWDDDLIDLPEDQLAAELARRAAAMDSREVSACHTAHYERGDISPLVVAGARERERRRRRVGTATP